MDAASTQGVEHDRQRRGQRLALAGAHLGDGAVVEHHAADELHVEVAHAHRALAGLADERETLGQQMVEARAALRPRAQFVGSFAKFGVARVLELRLEVPYLADALLVGLELLRLAHAKRAVQEGHGGERSIGPLVKLPV